MKPIRLCQVVILFGCCLLAWGIMAQDAKTAGKKTTRPKKGKTGVSSTGIVFTTSTPVSPTPTSLPARRYKGIVPGVRDAHPKSPRHSAKGFKPRITWVGFEPNRSPPRLFIQLKGDFTYQVSMMSPTTIVVDIPGARFYTRNDRRHIIARHFKTPIDEIIGKAIRRPRAVQVVVQLKEKARYSHHRQGNYIFIDFPPN